ncbi:MAG: hypothetical protein ACP5KG_12690 [Myxococcota bacterium]
MRGSALYNFKTIPCHNCGAPLTESILDLCEFCNFPINDGSLDWVLYSIVEERVYE